MGFDPEIPSYFKVNQFYLPIKTFFLGISAQLSGMAGAAVWASLAAPRFGVAAESPWLPGPPVASFGSEWSWESPGPRTTRDLRL